MAAKMVAQLARYDCSISSLKLQDFSRLARGVVQFPQSGAED
ncbi:hypothetical protein [Bradyrhizobium sacchari]|nr:hypothetical protein [Bradyrhizobium sacchari]